MENETHIGFKICSLQVSKSIETATYNWVDQALKRCQPLAKTAFSVLFLH